jgi:hypothetical protein
MTHQFFSFLTIPSVLSRSFFPFSFSYSRDFPLRSRSNSRVSLRASNPAISPPIAPRPSYVCL